MTISKCKWLNNIERTEKIMVQEVLQMAKKEIVVTYNQMFRHTPKSRLNNEQLAALGQNGLFHATTSDIAELIVNSELRPSKDGYLFRIEKDMVWLYPNDPAKNAEYIQKVLSKGKSGNKKTERKDYDTVIIFEGFTPEQIENLRSRDWDDAVTHNGALKTASMRVMSIKDFLSQVNN